MKPIVIFAVLGAALGIGKVGDVLNIPKSTLSYAKVTHKERKGARVENDSAPSGLFTIHRLSFEIDNHKILDLPVPKKTFNSVSEGSKGVLVHTDTRFRKFHVDKKIPDIIKPKKKSAGSNSRRKK